MLLDGQRERMRSARGSPSTRRRPASARGRRRCARRPVSDATEHAIRPTSGPRRDRCSRPTSSKSGSRSRASRGHDHAREGLVRRLALYRTPNPFSWGALDHAAGRYAFAELAGGGKESDQHLQRVTTRPRWHRVASGSGAAPTRLFCPLTCGSKRTVGGNARLIQRRGRLVSAGGAPAPCAKRSVLAATPASASLCRLVDDLHVAAGKCARCRASAGVSVLSEG